MAVSTARAIRSNTATVLQEKPLAQVIPFSARRKPLAEPISGRTNAQVIAFPTLNSPKEQPSVRPSAQAIALSIPVSPREQPSARPNAQVVPLPVHDIRPREKHNDAEICQAIKIESAREAKAKGQFTRKSEEALNINYQLAWIVWFRYVGIMLSMGIRVSEFLRHHVEFHDQMKRGH